jgi:hypothetical protein
MSASDVKATLSLDQVDAINQALAEIFTAAECLSCASVSEYQLSDGAMMGLSQNIIDRTNEIWQAVSNTDKPFRELSTK